MCKKLYRRNDNSHACNAKPGDYLLLTVSTGDKGEEAEKALEVFMAHAKKNLVVEVVNMPFGFKNR